MATIETAYDIGDVVFHAGTSTETFSHPCPDCLGSGLWKAVSPAGGEFSVACPRCGAGYQSNRALNLRYVQHTAYVRRLTIGSLKANSPTGTGSYDDGNSYMCVETGIGSGSIYNERDLFKTEAEALGVATTKAALANANTEGWVAKQYAETVTFSDYQLKDAQIEAAKSASSRALYDIGYLLEDLDEATSLNDVRERIAAWREKREAA